MAGIMIQKIKIWDFILLFVCFFLTFKQLNVIFPPSYTLLFLLIGCLVVLLYKTTNRLWDVSIMWLAFYTLVLVLNFLSGDTYFDSIGDVVQEVALLFFTSSLTYYIFTLNHVRLAKVLVLIALIIICYYSVSSFIIEQENPGIIRDTVYMYNLGELADLRLFYLRGLSTYQLPHAVPILIPPLIMGIRDNTNKKVLRIFFAISLFAVFVITFISYAATALFLSIILLILTLLIRQGSVQKNFGRLVLVSLVFLPILISPGTFLRPFSGLLSSAEDASYIDKLMDIQQLTDRGISSGSVAARETRYEITFNEIIEHPIIGTNEGTGEHSAIFDRLACLGLVGWIPYIVFLFFQYKTIKKRISKEAQPFYVLGVLAALFMLLTKNMSNWETWFMVFTVLPLMTWLQTQKPNNR